MFAFPNGTGSTDVAAVLSYVFPVAESAEQSARDRQAAFMASDPYGQYADHSDPDAMPSADDVAEMLAWQEGADEDDITNYDHDHVSQMEADACGCGESGGASPY